MVFYFIIFLVIVFQFIYIFFIFLVHVLLSDVIYNIYIIFFTDILLLNAFAHGWKGVDHVLN
jgi:hypothetical protein